MDAHDFAVWMQKEHRIVEELIQNLRELIGLIPRDGREDWIRELRSRFDHLRAHLTRHMAMEEHEGYMSHVLEQRPPLSAEVSRLKYEHNQFSRLMDNIHRNLAECEPQDRLLLHDCCVRIKELLACIERHEAQENLIVMSVFTDDIGTKD